MQGSDSTDDQRYPLASANNSMSQSGCGKNKYLEVVEPKVLLLAQGWQASNFMTAPYEHRS